MDDAIIGHYERGNDLAKVGKVKEALSEYKSGLELLQQGTSSDIPTRTKYFLEKLAQLTYKAGRYGESRKYYGMMGLKMPRPPIETQSFAKSVSTLQACGKLQQLTREIIDQTLEEMGVDSESVDDELEFIDFLQAYYGGEAGELSDRAIEDGFLSHDWKFWNETDDVIQELCALVGQPLLKKISSTTQPRSDAFGEETLITVENVSGQTQTLSAADLHGIVRLMNSQLKSAGSPKEFVSIDTTGDWYAYYLLDANQQKKIFAAKRPVLLKDQDF